jgi:hypothetical protein
MASRSGQRLDLNPSQNGLRQSFVCVSCVLFIVLANYQLKLIDPTEDDDHAGSDNEDEGPILPEIILDDDGYATLPARDGIGLKGQHELIRSIFHASYSKI